MHSTFLNKCNTSVQTTEHAIKEKFFKENKALKPRNSQFSFSKCVYIFIEKKFVKQDKTQVYNAERKCLGIRLHKNSKKFT